LWQISVSWQQKKFGRFLTFFLVYISTNFAKKEKIRQTSKPQD
jgi:hypothetical protein